MLPFSKKDNAAAYRSEVSNSCIKNLELNTWSNPAVDSDERLGIKVSTAKIITVSLNAATQIVVIIRHIGSAV